MTRRGMRGVYFVVATAIHPAGTVLDILDVVSLILDAIVKQQNKGGLA